MAWLDHNRKVTTTIYSSTPSKGRILGIKRQEQREEWECGGKQGWRRGLRQMKGVCKPTRKSTFSQPN